MPAKPTYLYSDASFSHTHRIGVVGFLLFKSSEENETGVVSRSKLQTFTETTSIRSELRAAILALEFTENEESDFEEIRLFTDCKAITGLLGRRKKLEAQNYMSARKNQSLSNADLYRRFFTVFDRVVPQMNWVKGHSPRMSLSPNQRNFRTLDQMVRKELRAQVKARAR